MNLDSFVVASVMVHDVPKGNDANKHLALTDVPIRLDDELRRYFQGKIVTSLKERGVEVVADDNEDDAVRTAIARILEAPANLVAGSRSIAERLDLVQTGRNPAGLLAIVAGTVGEQACVSVLKLEREQGLRFHIETVEGQRIVALEFLRDLTLTDKTKVFKASMFVGGGERKMTAAKIAGRVSDDQRGNEASAGVASFFLGTFLGCRLRDSPEKSTFEFVQAVDAFINEEVSSAERRGRYQIALLATMQDQTGAVQPRSFARNNIDPDDRPILLERIRAAGLEPDAPFAKDTTLVKVSGFRMTFDSGMVLVGSQRDLSERVHIRPDKARKPGVDINDTIKKLRGR